MNETPDIIAPQPQPGSSMAGILWTVIGVSLAIHVGCLIAGNTILKDWLCPHDPVHAAVEMSGGMIALWVAWMLMSLESRGGGTSFNVWIAGALIGMGVLDAMHALVHAGQTFVWLHSTATCVGGLLFACVWLPSRWMHKAASWWPWTVFVSVTLFGCWSMAYPEYTPAMLVENENGVKEFSAWAQWLNITGGVLLFAAAARIVRSWFRTNNIDDLLFCLHCALFGSAAIMFEQSQLWDLPWWGWHMLRLMAYAVAMWFVVLTELRFQREVHSLADQLKDFNSELERRVAARTEQLAVANEALERSNLDLQQFAYVASHDLQTPLRSIAGFAQFLKEDYGGKLGEEADGFIQQIIDGAMRMQRLMSDLLAYSRVESRAQQFSSVNLNQVVDDAVAMFDSHLRSGGGRVTRDKLPKVSGDNSQLLQLFQNLIGNGLKYRGDASPEVHVSAERGDNVWTIAVRDNGIGIASKHHDRIFEIFRRLHTQKSYSGTGIGLAICRRVAQRHGGEIRVESELGHGSTFFVTLPAPTAPPNAEGRKRKKKKNRS